VKLVQIRNSGPIKPNRWKHYKDEQLSTNQLSNGYIKASGTEENNDSSKSTTLTLLHSWTKLKSKAKQGHHKHNKRDKKTWQKDTRETDSTQTNGNTSNTEGFKAARYPWTSSKQFKTYQVLSSAQREIWKQHNLTKYALYHSNL